MKKPILLRTHSLTLVLIIFLASLLTSCGTTNTGSTPSNYEELRELVESKQFEVNHEWAQPVGGGNINLIGNINFIKFEGDSVDLFLPYFGVRHSGGEYGGQGGIEYQGPAENLVLNEEENSRIFLKFDAEQGSENLEFIITLFPNGNATTSVTSSQRQVISYRGSIKERKAAEE